MTLSYLFRSLPLVYVFASVLYAAPPADVEGRIDQLLARMTLDEKIGQMSQGSVLGSPVSERSRQQIREGRWGSFLNTIKFEDRAEAQRIALKESRLGIPLIFGRDVIHGYRTMLPIPLGQAATWDPDLVEQGARVAAREASSVGIQWTFAPMIDVARDPRWGRISEGMGEDPYLASLFAAAMVRGLSGPVAGCPGLRRGLRQALCGLWRGGGRARLQQRVDPGDPAARRLPAAVPGRPRRRRRHLHERVRGSQWGSGDR